MKSYDDLQRFKEKTQTNHIEFREMSEQSNDSDSANWAIIKQLMSEGETSTLGSGQLTGIAPPQPIAGDTFTALSAATGAIPHSTPAARQSSDQPHSVAAWVAKPAAAQPGASLLESISASLKPAPAASSEPAPAAAYSSPDPATPAMPSDGAVDHPADRLNAARTGEPSGDAQRADPLATVNATDSAPFLSLMASLPAAPARPTAVDPAASAAAPAALAKSTAEQAPRFRQLFSAASEPTAITKDTLLQPLLEKIASCR